MEWAALTGGLMKSLSSKEASLHPTPAAASLFLPLFCFLRPLLCIFLPLSLFLFLWFSSISFCSLYFRLFFSACVEISLPFFF